MLSHELLAHSARPEVRALARVLFAIACLAFTIGMVTCCARVRVLLAQVGKPAQAGKPMQVSKSIQIEEQ
jgi:hypothetical protein